jgi:hypothetical protein
VQWPKRPNISHRQEGWRGKHLTDESIKKIAEACAVDTQPLSDFCRVGLVPKSKALAYWHDE